MARPQLERWQCAIVLAHIALAILYGAIIPPWEAHDETGHFAYVSQIVNTHSLPDARSTDRVFLDQSHQPPLYYLVVAALTFWIDHGEQVSPQLNVFAFDGTNRRGTRILLRQPGEAFPWQGTILSLHAARIVSALLSALSILLISMASRLLFTNHPHAALLTTAIAAFNPQVLFMAAMVNNDVMISLIGSALALLLMECNRWPVADSRQPGSQTSSALDIRSRTFILIGVILAAGMWTKNSSLILLPFTAAALSFLAFRQRWAIRAFVIRGMIVAAVTVVGAAPFYVSNYLRYGQWIVDRAAESPLIQAPTSVIGAGILVSLRDRWLPEIFINAFRTFWGTFGWGNVQMPDIVYTLIALLCLAGIVGFIVGLRGTDRTERNGLCILILLGVAMLILPGYRAIYYQNPALLPGRYLMPALAAYAGILGFGWTVIGGFSIPKPMKPLIHLTQQATERTRKLMPGVIPGICGLFALLTPLAWIAPVYAPPQIRKMTDLSSALLRFEDVAQVTDVSASTTYLADREGMRQYAHVQLTWQALKATPTNYTIGISVLGRDSEVLGNLNVQPARGNYPSSNWQPGDTFDDDYYVLLEKPCPSLPALGQVSVSLFEYNSVGTGSGTMSITHQLEVRDGAGRVVSPIIGRFRIEKPTQAIPVFWQPAIAMFDSIALRQVDMPGTVLAGASLPVTMTYEVWRGGAPIASAFVHLSDGQGNTVAQDDHQPLHGSYPTDLWQAGDCVVDHFTLPVPVTATGTLQAVTGFYSQSDNVRFHTGTQDDLVPLGKVQVGP